MSIERQRIPVRMVVALACEARPLIRRYRLKLETERRPFRVYSSRTEDEDVRLVVAGAGRVPAAAATGFLAGLDRRSSALWLNVGSAGARAHDGRSAGSEPAAQVGDVVLAHKVVEMASGRGFYPPIVFESPVPTTTVYTVDEIERRFPVAGAYDLEASAFLATANRATSAELAHCIKVVSDTEREPADRLDAAMLEGLVEGAVTTIDRVLEAMRSAVDVEWQETSQLGVDAWLKRARFTVTQQRQLEELLRRADALGVDLGAGLAEDLSVNDVAGGAAALLARMEAVVSSAPVRLGSAETE